MIEYYREENFKTSKWSGGKTREILLLPEGSSYQERSFCIRLSSATIDVPSSRFTHLEGVKRFITPLSHPFLLEVNGTPPFLLCPFEVFQFSGSDVVQSYGMSVDFNLMLSEGRAEGWMKTLKPASTTSPLQSAEVCIALDKGDVFWIFSYLTAKILVNGTVQETEDCSFLMLKNIKEHITLSSNQNIVYGCIKPII